MTGNQPPPSDVALAFDAMPLAARSRLLSVRELIFETADDAGAGPLIETLKWGEPAYLAKAGRVGTTIRLGLTDQRPAVFFNCQTRLVEGAFPKSSTMSATGLSYCEKWLTRWYWAFACLAL